MVRRSISSESVLKGHPDKVCDQISDAILDETLKQDPNAKMAVEVSIKDECIFIYGEKRTKANIDVKSIANCILKNIGYPYDYKYYIKISDQSEEINNAVEKKDRTIGAGDQGIMFGFACNETDEYMPASIYYAHKLAQKMDFITKQYSELGPDGKTQVTAEYDDNKLISISCIILSIQHKKNISQSKIKEILLKEVIDKVIPQNLITANTIILINPSGSFIKGGSFGDSGTTGRKIVVDAYGGDGHVGGGCFSSKDPSKVDRTAAYYARYVCKSLVANKLVDRCELQLAYAIGESEPVSIYINTFGTEKININKLYDIIKKNFNFNVKNMIDELSLKRPIFLDTACYGHFGRDIFPWEKVKKIV